MGNDSMREFSEKYYAAAATSAANAGYCERLFVMDMGQHGFAEVSHLDHLMAVSGIDFIPSAIQQSQERTQAKADRLHFQVMDIAELDFPAASFDALASIDALYFCNLEETLRRTRYRGARRPAGLSGWGARPLPYPSQAPLPFQSSEKMQLWRAAETRIGIICRAN